MTRRPEWRQYYLGICDAVASRADCTRRKVGAIVVRDNSIVATGYNGAPPGEPGCLSNGACPRGKHYISRTDGVGIVRCGCGMPWPCPESVAPDSSYATGKGACIAIHAELNALLRAGSISQGATLYCTDKPCDACWRAVKGAGIVHAYWYGGEWHRDTPVTRSSYFIRWLRGMMHLPVK